MEGNGQTEARWRRLAVAVTGEVGGTARDE